MKTTRQCLLVAFAALLIVSRVAAADPDLTGTWTLGVEDHVIPMAVVMKPGHNNFQHHRHADQ
jgi:hypothetical protein